MYIENPNISFTFFAIRIILESDIFHFLNSSSDSLSVFLLFQSILYKRQQPSFSYNTNNKLSLINSKYCTLLLLFILVSLKSVFFEIYKRLNTSSLFDLFLLLFSFSFSVNELFDSSFLNDIIESFLLFLLLLLLLFILGGFVIKDIFLSWSSNSFLFNEFIISSRLPIS